MNKLSKIYVAGHEGLIGSALLNKLNYEGHQNLLYYTYKDLDLFNKSDVDTMFRICKPRYVFLIAAKNGGINSVVTKPADFILNNLIIQTNIIDAAKKYSVKKLLFVSSSNVYPKDYIQPLKEEYLFNGSIDEHTSSYAVSKLAGIELCKSYNKQFNTNFVPVIHCNAYGERDNFSLSDAGVIPSLIHKMYIAKCYKHESVVLWGDGTPKREFIHSEDLAGALYLIMKNYSSNDPINVGVDYDVHINFLSRMIKDIIKYKGEIKWDNSYPNGVSRKLLDSSKIKSLGWKSTVDLEHGIKRTYKWFLNNYKTLRK